MFGERLARLDQRWTRPHLPGSSHPYVPYPSHHTIRLQFAKYLTRAITALDRSQGTATTRRKRRFTRPKNVWLRGVVRQAAAQNPPRHACTWPNTERCHARLHRGANGRPIAIPFSRFVQRLVSRLCLPLADTRVQRNTHVTEGGRELRAARGGKDGAKHRGRVSDREAVCWLRGGGGADGLAPAGAAVPRRRTIRRWPGWKRRCTWRRSGSRSCGWTCKRR